MHLCFLWNLLILSNKHAQWDRTGEWAPGQKKICQADVAFVQLADYSLKASNKTNRRQGARVEGQFSLAYLVLSLLLYVKIAWFNSQTQWIPHPLSVIWILLSVTLHIKNSVQNYLFLPNTLTFYFYFLLFWLKVAFLT